MLDKLNSLDRRWIFLAMAIAVALPILLGIGSDETPSLPTKKLFDRIEELPAGSRILMAIDYDPNSAAELAPMSLAFTRHCCLRRHKIYFVTLWGTALPMIDMTIKEVVQAEFGSGEKPFQYGEDYVNLGYLPGETVAINQLTSDIRKARSQYAWKRAAASSTATAPTPTSSLLPRRLISTPSISSLCHRSERIRRPGRRYNEVRAQYASAPPSPRGRGGGRARAKLYREISSSPHPIPLPQGEGSRCADAP